MSSDTLPKVLLVDDNQETCTLIRALLRHEFSVETAHDGVNAAQTLETREFAAVLLDLRMPQMDGFGVLDALRATRPGVLSRVLIVTASLTPAEIARAKSYGIHGLIAKPFEVEHFLAAVRRCAQGPGESHLAPILSGGVLILLADLLRQRWPL